MGAMMAIPTCSINAAYSNDSNYNSSTPVAWFAGGTACRRQRIGNLRSWTSWRSYKIVDGTNDRHVHHSWTRMHLLFSGVMQADPQHDANDKLLICYFHATYPCYVGLATP